MIMKESNKRYLVEKWCMMFLCICLQVSTESVKASMNPTIDFIGGCYDAFMLTGGELKKRSITGMLYINDINSMGDSVDVKLYKKYSISGFVSPDNLDTKALVFSDNDDVHFTGDMYLRKASILERYVAGGSDKLFYEVVLNGVRYILLQIYIDFPFKKRGCPR